MLILSGKLYQGTQTGHQNHAAKQIIQAKHHNNQAALEWCAEVLKTQLLPYLGKFDCIVPVQSIQSKYSIPQIAAIKMLFRHGVKVHFALSANNSQANYVVGQRVALIDDVLDSGATARKCIQAIQKAGGRVVLLAAVAHSEDFDPDKFTS